VFITIDDGITRSR